MKSNKWYGSVGKIIIFIGFCIFAALIIVPLIWMLISSVKGNTE